MKQITLVVSTLLIGCAVHSQSLAEFKNALGNNQKKLQAIHKYPENIKDGECHYVEITSITQTDNKITIVETWTDGRGSTANTTLTGILTDNAAQGNWQSTYSSGTWSYNFKTNAGRWNKTKAPLQFGTFKEFQPLHFTVVNNNQIKDDFYDCN